MERESFEDEEVAALLNENYVSIKVDREERPDLDHVYMQYCQALTGAGGWPLTVFLTPDKKPFYAGTYFPKKSAFGRPGLIDVLKAIADQWTNNRADIEQASDEHTLALIGRATDESPAGKQMDEALLHKAFGDLRSSFDDTWGGFGRSPKFPSPHNIMYLLRYHKWTGDLSALSMATQTLDAMHDGGMYDHIGGGFCRYSTDRRWLVPHFEKMLYDNAMLTTAYTEAYQLTGDERYATVARETIGYILRDMTSVDGAFCSSEDADSEGEEGKFYVWTPQEIDEVVGAEIGQAVSRWYGVTPKGNFEGKSILNRIERGVLAGGWPDGWAEILNQARERLLAARSRRVRPARDDKVLTSWNGLMIAALAHAGRVFGDESLIDHAIRAAESVLEKLRRSDGRLMARYRDGEAAYPGYLDDYANMIWALIELHQADFNPRWLWLACELQDEQNRLFWDGRAGGYYFYGEDAEQLIARPKEVDDGAMPSGNSVAASNLLRLGRLMYRPEYLEMAEALFEAFGSQVSAYPAGHTHLLSAHMMAIGPSQDVLVASNRDETFVRTAAADLLRAFSPGTSFMYLLKGDTYERLRDEAPYARDATIRGGDPTYYLCKDFACRPPTSSLGDIVRSL